MKLLQFKSEGFRSLKQIPFVKISSNNLTIITGQNDGGKTSLIDALGFFTEKNKTPPSRDFFTNNQISSIAVVFSGIFILSEEEKEKIDHYSKYCHIRKTCYRTGHSEYSYKTMIFPGDERFSKLSKLKIVELRALLDQYNIPCRNRSTTRIILEDIKSWLSTKTLVSSFASAPSQLIDMLPEVIKFSSSDVFNPKNEVLTTLKASFRRRIQEPKYVQSFASIQEEITTEMKTDLDAFENILKRYCDDVEEMEIAPQFDFTNGFTTTELLLKKTGGVPIIFENEGEGRKRKFTLAIHEWRKNILTTNPLPGDTKQRIIIYDEPDTHLDYQSQRQILDKIKAISDVDLNSVIICTHSLNLIDRIPIMDIIHLFLSGDETNVNTLNMLDSETIDHFLFNLNDNMGLKNSVLLNEKAFLIVEGETEMGALPILFHKYKQYSLQSAGIRILNGYNCGSARLFAKFLNENNRNVLFLVDTDVKTHQSNIFNDESLEEDGFDLATQVNYIGVVEFEDTFDDTFWARTSNNHFAKDDGTVWIPADFTALRAGDFAEDVKNMLCRETRSRVTKPTMGLALAKEVANVTEIPQDIVDCFDNALALVV